VASLPGTNLTFGTFITTKIENAEDIENSNIQVTTKPDGASGSDGLTTTLPIFSAYNPIPKSTNKPNLTLLMRTQNLAMGMTVGHPMVNLLGTPVE
jgi:hypothetical protein